MKVKKVNIKIKSLVICPIDFNNEANVKKEDIEKKLVGVLISAVQEFESR